MKLTIYTLLIFISFSFNKISAQTNSRTFFSDPDTNDKVLILNNIIKLIGNTKKGDTIRAGLYSFTSGAVYDALDSAVTRGVIIQIVIDGKNAKYLSKLEDLLNDNDKCKDCIIIACGHGEHSSCISNTDGAIQHQKYFIFSSTSLGVKKMEKAVLVTSSNMTYGSKRQYNDAFISWGEDYWYDKWNEHWTLQSLQKHYKDNDYYDVPAERGYFKDPKTFHTAYFSPNNQNDLWVRRIRRNRIPGKETSQQGDCSLYINQKHFSDGRAAVANEVDRIAKEGCKVKLIVNKGALGQENKTKFEKNSNITIKYSGRTHHKYMMYEGIYDGKFKTRVWLGSHNLTSPSKRKDEVIVKVGQREVYNDYKKSFESLWNKL